MPRLDSSTDETFDLEKLEATIAAEQQEEMHILQSLDFDWRHSPRIDHGLISGHPINGPVPLEFTLPTGRRINLKLLYQFDVYGGMLCGMPRDPEGHFIGAVNAAKRHFPNHRMMPVVLEPVFHAGQILRKGRVGGETHEPWLKLPEVCTIAEFDSKDPARDECEVYSSVLAIWFQDHYGLPDDVRTLEQLGNMDWAKHGYDWTP